MGQQSIYHQAPIHLYRCKDARISTARSHRIDQVALAEDHRLTAYEVCCRHRQRDPQFLKSAYSQHTLQQSDQAIIRAEPVAGDGVTANILKTNQRCDLGKFLSRYPTRISGANYGADACTCNVINRNVVFFENFEDTNVGQPAGKTTTECKSDRGSFVMNDGRRNDRNALNLAFECAEGI